MIGLADLEPVPDGTRLYDCKVRAGETAGVFPLVCPEGLGVEPPFQPAMSGSSPLSEEPPSYETVCSDAIVTVPATDDAHLTIGSTSVAPGGGGTIDVTLHTLGTSVAGLLNDIGFDPGAAIAERVTSVTTLAADVGAEDLLLPIVNGDELPGTGHVRIDDEIVAYQTRKENQLLVAARGALGTVAAPHLAGTPLLLLTALPDCESTSELLDAGFVAVFSFLPDGCSAGIDCFTIRAIVISPSGGTIPDAIPLYSCQIEAGKADGTFPLTCPVAQGVAPSKGGQLAVSCGEGRVIVGSGPTLTPTPTSTATVADTPSTPTPSATEVVATATFTARLVATATPTPVPLPGDCDRDGCVALNEVVFGVGIALGGETIDDCPSLDENDDRVASIDELINSVDNSMQGCAAATR
jgi:hypothetical protein